MNLSTFQKIFINNLILTLLLTLSVGSYLYTSNVEYMMDSLRSRLSNSAALLSQFFDVHELETIRNKEDIDTEVYQRNVQIMRNLVQSNADLAFIYIMRREKDTVSFVLDSDISQAAMPGEKYETVIEELTQGFMHASADRQITHDQWGSFLSGYAPLPQGDQRYLIGLDMRADEVTRKLENLKQAAMITILVSILLAIALSFLLAKHFTRRLRILTEKASVIAHLPKTTEEVKGDELDTLTEVFNLMADHVNNAQKMNIEARDTLQHARNTLESHVEQRTAELKVVNERLTLEIEERKKTEEKLAISASSDYLTGTLNRRAMIQKLEHEIQQTSSGHPSFCLIFMDIDYFKKFNDQYGHELGDQVLCSVAEQLNESSRNCDMVARWGGEEFVLLLPETPLKVALVIAERLRQDIAAYVISFNDQPLQITASFGISQHVDGVQLDDTIALADTAMYHAKKQGRNRVLSA